MHLEYITSIIRHVLTSTGSLFVAKGLTDQATVESIIGGLMAVIGLVWSLVHKKAVIQDRTAFGKPLNFGLLLLLGGTMAGCTTVHYESRTKDGEISKLRVSGVFAKGTLEKLRVTGTEKTKGLSIGSLAGEVDAEGIAAAGGSLERVIGAAVGAAIKSK